MIRNAILFISLIFAAYSGVCQNNELIKFSPGDYFNIDDADLKQLNIPTDTSEYYGIDDSEFCIQFPGGDKAFRKYLKKSILLPKDSVTSSIEGKVIVSFTVNEKGKVGNVVLEKGLYDPIDKILLKVVSEMPDWIWVCKENPQYKISTKRYLPISIIQDKKKKRKMTSSLHQKDKVHKIIVWR